VNNRVAVGLLALALTACSGGDIDIDDIRDHQKSWRAESITDYVTITHPGCRCALTDLHGVRTVVKNGVVVDAVGASSGFPLELAALTLDDAFDEAISRANRDPDKFEIYYDDTLHFVQAFDVDPDKNKADDESIFFVSCFSTDLDAGCPVKTVSASECAELRGEIRAIVAEDPWNTCANQFFPGAIGRIDGEDSVCCLS
jgi:hypothetical protein